MVCLRTLRWAAWHEAGHAVAEIAAGGMPAWVEITEIGRARTMPGEHRLSTTQEVTCLLAGMMMEWHAGNEEPWPGGRNDRTSALLLLHRATGGDAVECVEVERQLWRDLWDFSIHPAVMNTTAEIAGYVLLQGWVGADQLKMLIAPRLADLPRIPAMSVQMVLPMDLPADRRGPAYAPEEDDRTERAALVTPDAPPEAPIRTAPATGATSGKAVQKVPMDAEQAARSLELTRKIKAEDERIFKVKVWLIVGTLVLQVLVFLAGVGR